MAIFRIVFFLLFSASAILGLNDVGPNFEEAIKVAIDTDHEVKVYFENDFLRLILKDGYTKADVVRSLIDCQDKVASGGKSGASFIKTKDNRFILKTITKDEFETFQNIAKNYFEYMKASPKTLLITFYGLFKVKGIVPRYLILMPNLIKNRTIDTKVYDLKGRAKKPGHFNSKMIDDNTLPDPPSFAITKVGESQLLEDIAFLEKQGLLDYSLFVIEQGRTIEGIHLIDFLTRYDWKKQVANFFKQSVWDEQQLSTIPPKKYATRMRFFVMRCAAYRR